METNKDTDAAVTMDEIRDWVATRKAAAATIDLETCELGCWDGFGIDPYGLLMAQGELPEEMRQIGKNRFVRSPQSNGWVNEGDLSPAQVKAMYARIEREYREWEAGDPNWQGATTTCRFDHHKQRPRVRLSRTTRSPGRMPSIEREDFTTMAALSVILVSGVEEQARPPDGSITSRSFPGRRCHRLRSRRR